MEVCSNPEARLDPALIYPIEGWELNLGDLCEKGSQLRPNIVWFGELVPMIEVAARHAMQADIFLVVGTSLQVYPAAGLIHEVPYAAPKFLVDPNITDNLSINALTSDPREGNNRHGKSKD
jgi:NAD-dependent deacetylase